MYGDITPTLDDMDVDHSTVSLGQRDSTIVSSVQSGAAHRLTPAYLLPSIY